MIKKHQTYPEKINKTLSFSTIFIIFIFIKLKLILNLKTNLLTIKLFPLLILSSKHQTLVTFFLISKNLLAKLVKEKLSMQNNKVTVNAKEAPKNYQHQKIKPPYCHDSSTIAGQPHSKTPTGTKNRKTRKPTPQPKH